MESISTVALLIIGFGMWKLPQMAAEDLLGIVMGQHLAQVESTGGRLG